jgi:hypothetical protein
MSYAWKMSALKKEAFSTNTNQLNSALAELQGTNELESANN